MVPPSSPFLRELLPLEAQLRQGLVHARRRRQRRLLHNKERVVRGYCPVLLVRHWCLGGRRKEKRQFNVFPLVSSLHPIFYIRGILRSTFL